MIGRIWRGWTTRENADTYEALLRNEVFPQITAMHIRGYRGIQLLRRLAANEVEFTTIMWFDSLDAVKVFAGSDYRRASISEKARSVLLRYDEHATHYRVRDRRVC